jgi:L-aminopeptidase/D-esterase-like protein
MGDCDVIFCLGAGAPGAPAADLTQVGAIAAWTMAQAIVNAVRTAESLRGVPSYRELRGRS